MFNLIGQTVIVTGSARGIGQSIAVELAKQGANVVVTDIIPGNATVNKIKNLKRKSFFVKVDASKKEEVENVIAETIKKFKKIDILVNNAGIMKDRTLKNMTQEEWQKVIDVNLTGVYNVTKNALLIMEDNGRIISISSVVGISGNFGQCNYSASKAGLIGFTKSLAKELGKQKITVNAVAPGFIETDMTKEISFLRKKMILALIPLKEFGKQEDVANAIVFLSSDKARYISGEVLNVSAGLSF